MAYSTSYNASPKVPTFVTKVAHDVTLTETDSRVFIKNIKTGVTLDHFKCAMEKYGPVQVYLYEHGSKDNGWAWVGFENKEVAMQAVKDYEKRAEEEEEAKTVKEEESNTAYEGNVKEEETRADKDAAHSYYAENEENNENFEEPNDENDETDEHEEEEEE